MKTPTHALLGFALAKICRFNKQQTGFCIAGAVLPDLPLILTSLYLALMPMVEKTTMTPTLFKHQMDALYFDGSWLPVAHNLLHAPLSILYAALAATIICFNRPDHHPLIRAFALGALSHSLLDVISHIDDGPLILWPLDSSLRLTGLFSHWALGRGGGIITGLEIIVSLAIFANWARKKASVARPKPN